FDILVQNGIKVFVMLLDRPAIETFWWPRFLRIAQWIIDEEARRNYEVKTIEAEQLGEIIWQAPYGQFSLKAYMDRIEILHSGSMRIIDYKTTKPPTNAEVERNIAAQLLLEAAMAQYGTIGGESRNGVVGGVEYWHLKGGQENATVQMVSSKNKSLEEMVNDALDGVKNLIASYDDENTPYLHVPVEANAPRYDDFAHLARDLEWRGNV
ncbi:MAG: PD-(D/E)XK nuclease family protein, partial [Alphaproteobacteria bacterium]|nr:PD-(D/E)XK nuclease family protein [Alphaproteobacteria bacterium]